MLLLDSSGDAECERKWYRYKVHDYSYSISDIIRSPGL